jgi:transposase-like protein
VPHEVYGSREGRVARFVCHLCRESRLVAEGQFEALNAFIEKHRHCVERWPVAGAP